MQGLSLKIFSDDLGDVSVAAVLNTRAFRGECSYPYPPEEFEDLPERFSIFPIAADRVVDGLWCDGCIYISIQPENSVGDLRVKVELNEFSSDWNKCQSQFIVNYGDLDRFRDEVSRAIASGAGEAELTSALSD